MCFKMELLLDTWLLVIVLSILLLFIYSSFKTSVLREFPGPRSIPFLGILPQMIKKELAYAGEMAYSAVTLAIGEHWKFLRNVLSPSFSPAKLKQMFSSIEDCSDQLISQIKKQSQRNTSVNMDQICQGFSMDVICGTAFGLKTRPDFLQLMINNYKGESATDIKNGTIEMYKQRGITETEILANSLIFFLDGYDTTAAGLIFSIYRMAVHQDHQERLFQEINHEIGKDSPSYEQIMKLQYLDMFFCEVMRMYPPSTRTNRKTMKSVTVNGYRIPDGVEVTVPIYAMHYDPELWPEPETFDPERFSAVNKETRSPYSYMPFGHGPRNCIGMRLANLETKMAMVRILQHFRLKPTPDTKYLRGSLCQVI
ncbi:cytochrome P450 3A28-like [Mytilus californianus]|uniref:cytochrome P450 3A28-like n=1 Tax=Mytilus californianus TaxID=6549 RepID=UPI0022467960|nr:cytochrome P450 3A28-like [Mytilus californianus]